MCLKKQFYSDLGFKGLGFSCVGTKFSIIIYRLSSRKDNTQCDINVHGSKFYLRVVILYTCTCMYIMSLYILDYLKHRNCFNHQMLMYKSCHQRRQARVNQLKREDQYNLQICEYVSYNTSTVPDNFACPKMAFLHPAPA